MNIFFECYSACALCRGYFISDGQWPSEVQAVLSPFLKKETHYLRPQLSDRTETALQISAFTLSISASASCCFPCGLHLMVHIYQSVRRVHCSHWTDYLLCAPPPHGVTCTVVARMTTGSPRPCFWNPKPNLKPQASHEVFSRCPKP